MKYYIDLITDNYTYRLGVLRYGECIDLAKELNMEYEFTKRKKIPNQYEIEQKIELPEINVCRIYKKKNLFTDLITGTTIQKTTD